MDEPTRQNVIKTLIAEPTLTVLTADGLKPDSVAAPVTGYAPQPWSAEPTRAGWWWLWHPRWMAMQFVYVDETLRRMRNGEYHFDAPYGDPWRWAGPVDPPPAPDAETGHIGKVCEPGGPGASTSSKP